MRDRGKSALIGGFGIFLVLSTVAQTGVAALYARGVYRLKSAPSIRERDVRVLARPVRIHTGQRISMAEIASHLQRLGYVRGCADEGGCYTTPTLESLAIRARYPEFPDITIRWVQDEIVAILGRRGEILQDAAIEPETIVTTTAHPGSAGRTRNDPLPYAALAGTPLLDAIIASEDRWFPSHHGLDVLRLALAPLSGSGGSTITMQVARLNVLQDRSRTVRRKLNEIGIAMAIERRYSKDAIVTAYANSVYLGVSRGRSIHGFGAAAQEFFGVRDVRQLSAVQAATLVALLNQPSRYLADLNQGDDSRLRRQRNRVLRLMQKNFPERYPQTLAGELENLPVSLVPPPVSSDVLYRVSRHFLDYAAADVTASPARRLYLTMDPRLQRIAAETIDAGLEDIEERLPGRVRRHSLEAALIAIDPRTGDVLAMVGGRSYDNSQFNRTVSAARQVGSIMKPFTYLAAFERAAAEGRPDVTPETLVLDTPTVFHFAGRRPWKPANYGDRYAGVITFRQALAESRNVATVKVAAAAGFGRIARLWQAASGQQLDGIHPSIALGAVEATPAQVAAAYTIFATGGVATALRTVGAVANEAGYVRVHHPVRHRVAHEKTTHLVTDMLRSVVEEGTARAARTAGFTDAAAGKTGTTDALRDAWFAGFSGDLLAVVWVGRDDARPLGLTGAEAALPLWTAFMKRARE
jgi:penicillin-binding protein 1B